MPRADLLRYQKRELDERKTLFLKNQNHGHSRGLSAKLMKVCQKAPTAQDPKIEHNVKQQSPRRVCDVSLCEAPPVNRQRKESTVPKSRFPFSAFDLAPSTLSRIHLIFVAEK